MNHQERTHGAPADTHPEDLTWDGTLKGEAATQETAEESRRTPIRIVPAQAHGSPAVVRLLEAREGPRLT